MKTVVTVMLAAGIAFLPQLLNAQTAATPDSVVQITAEAQGLQLVTADQLSPFGTFWLVMAGCGATVPLPCPPDDPTQPIYQIADEQYLVDGTIGQVLPHATSAANSILEAQASAVVDLINKIQATQLRQQMTMAMGMDSPPAPGGSGNGDGDFYLNDIHFVLDTNLLWLEITNVANGLVYANLHHATNQVYAIWSSTNLATPFPYWQVETEVWPTDTNCWPFTVPTLDRQDLFLRAEDWTDVDSNSDGVPDWWILKYFGSLLHSASETGLNGLSLLESYQRGLNPNVPILASGRMTFANGLNISVFEAKPQSFIP